LQIGFDVKRATDGVDYLVGSVFSVQETNDGALLGEILDVEAVLRAGPTGQGVEEGTAGLAGGRWDHQFLVVGPFEDQPVSALGGTECMPVNAVVVALVVFGDRTGFRKTVVVKAFAVLGPGDAGELAPFQDFGEVLAGIQIADVDVPLV